MTPHQLSTYGETARALASLIFKFQETEEVANLEVDGRRVSVDPPYFYHYSTSLWERASAILWKLGVLRPINERDGWATVFKFNCDPEDAGRVAIDNAENGPSLKEIVENFIAIRSDFTRKYSDQMTFKVAGQALFAIGVEEVRLFEALKILNYVKPADGDYTVSDGAIEVPDYLLGKL